MSHRLFAAFRGLLYATCFAAAWWWVVVSVRPLDDRMGLVLPPWLRGVGLVLVTVGVLVALICVAFFAVAGRGTPAPFDAPREFVASGPYRWVRNPMYLGAVAVITGSGLMLGSVAALGVAVGFLALAHAFVVLYEEPTLEARFGESYRRYRTAVNRWVPRAPAGALQGRSG